MFGLKNEISSHQANYNDGFINTKKLIMMSEFILENSFEEQYVAFLKKILQMDEWQEFQNEIKETINEYEITQDDIHQAMVNFIKIPAC